MRIVFLSNYYNHHQHSLCEALYRCCESFCFISTGMMREERRKMGYCIREPKYVLHAYEPDQIETARSRVREADVILYGAVQKPLSDPRLYHGKTVFYYSERLFKKPPNLWLLPLKAVRYYYRFRYRQNSYLLAASAYASADFSRTRTFRGRCFCWGYFPETKQYDIALLQKKKDRKKILWCGRLLDWKHPEHAVETARRLKAAGMDFSLDIIGGGEQLPTLEGMIKAYGLGDRVRLLGAVSKDEVRTHMEQAGIFLFTSDRQEGWGAVLNEAMNSGCAVVANHAAGAVPYLIQNGENGFVYQSGDCDGLIKRTMSLLEKPEMQNKIGLAAYQTILHIWNAENASMRLVALAEQLLAGEPCPEFFESGPCSRALLLHDDWFRE